MQKIRVVFQYQGQMTSAHAAAIAEVVALAGVAADRGLAGWESTGEAPPTIWASYDIGAGLDPDHGSHPPPADWLKTGLQALLATYEALPPDSPQRKLGKQVGFGWVGGSNRLNGQPHDVCAEIRALLAG